MADQVAQIITALLRQAQQFLDDLGMLRIAMSKKPLAARATAVSALTDQGSRRQFQLDFLGRASDVGAFLQLLDSVPDGLFFLKDEASRFVWLSKKIRRRLGLQQEWDVPGRTDHEFHAKHLADSFVRDDQTVLRTGQPVIGRVEIWFNGPRQLDWGMTSKFPVHDAAGRIVGVLGMMLSLADKSVRAAAAAPVGLILRYIQDRCDRLVGVEELAEAAQLSPRQLLRLVRREFGLNVHQLAMKTRIQAASDALLHKKATIGGIATDFGFCDQSAFTHQFRKYTGLTPSAFLRKYRTSDAADSA